MNRAVFIVVFVLCVLLTGCGGDELIVYDLANEVERRSLGLVQSRLEFDMDDHARGHFLAGWTSHMSDLASDLTSNEDPVTFTRMVGDRGRLSLSVFDTERRTLSLRGRALNISAGQTQGLRVRLNGQILGRVELESQWRTSTLTIPETLLQNGDNPVTLILASGKDKGKGKRDPNVLVDLDFLGLDDPINSLKVDGDRIIQPARSELRIPVIFPGKAGLKLAAQADMEGGEASVRVLLRRSGEPESEIFNASTDAWPQGEIRLDLNNTEAHHGELVFQVLARGEAQGTVTWERPQLIGDPGDMDRHTNVVLIVIDTLRSDLLSAYGGEASTPHMDALASSGVLFKQSYAHIPMTMPSHSSMFTSLLPSEHGARLNAGILPFEHLTLAELLQGSSRRTTGFVSLGVLSSKYGIAQGFDEYHDDFGLTWWKNADQMNQQILPWLEQRLQRQSKSADEAPFFLWAHYSDPHEPYLPPGTQTGGLRATVGEDSFEIPLDSSVQALNLQLGPGESEMAFKSLAFDGDGQHPVRIWEVQADGAEIRCGSQCRELPAGVVGWSTFEVDLPGSLVLTSTGQQSHETEMRLRALQPVSQQKIRELYRAEVEYVDGEVGRLLEALRRGNANERTLVVLTSDHGEGLGDHGLGGHVDQLYDSLLRVPLIISYPGHLPAGKVIDQPVSHVDLLPTVVDLLAIPDPGERRGRSLLPMMSEEPGTARPMPIFGQTFRPLAPRNLHSIVHRGFKMIHAPDQPHGAMRLYELAPDPEELENLADERPDQARQLRRILDARMKLAESVGKGVAAGELSAQDREMLKALGYLD